MRKVIYGAACSFDGFIAGPGGAMDWLHFSKDVQDFMAKFWPTIDTIVMGRGTWEVSAAQPPADAPATPGIQTYVFSRTLQKIDRPGVQLTREDAGPVVARLKKQPGKDICVMGGGILGTSLLDAGVVDEVGVNMHPVILGDGIPLFRRLTKRVPLRLKEARQIHGGCVLLTYKVT
jgi:dihydrofolate reductase